MIGRIPVIDIAPVVEAGKYPVKAVVNESIEVTCSAFREGHDLIRVDVIVTAPDGSETSTRMEYLGLGHERYRCTIKPDFEGMGSYTVEASADPVATWRHRAEIKLPAGIDVELELEEGAILLERAAAIAEGEDSAVLTQAAADMRDESRSADDRLAVAENPAVSAALTAHPLKDLITHYGPFPLQVDRQRALYGAWYEFFPRSEGATLDPPRSGTFRTAMKRLDGVAAMGFDVLYLPPIHPIGTSFRKGPNNTLTPGPDDPGSPWAIGAPEGGHDAIHPDLGTLEDFDAFVARATELGIEVALDLALQASPDHPWVKEHPEWFAHRADGTIAYAENPPKKYQDIYPIYFDADYEGFRDEVERVLRFWMERGIRIFRVDNPHTKPVHFWEDLFARIYETDPDVIFLAEAFTKPPMMRALATTGFHQSYTYFTWRNSKWELEEYFTELSKHSAGYMRPNCFVNTPDINPFFLQHSGPAGFVIRATLGAMLSPTYGVYAGFELCEGEPIAPGKEEYLDSEKFQYRPRDWDAAEAEGRSLAPYLRMLNQIRREHPALHYLRNLTFHPIDNYGLIAFSKKEGDDVVVTVCVLDPHSAREGTMWLDLDALGFAGHESVLARDLISGKGYVWGRSVYIRLDPHVACAHVVTLEPLS